MNPNRDPNFSRSNETSLTTKASNRQNQTRINRASSVAKDCPQRIETLPHPCSLYLRGHARARARMSARPRARAWPRAHMSRVRMSARPIKRSCSETARKWPRNRVLARNTRRCAPFARPPPTPVGIMPGRNKRSRPFRNGPVPELGFVAKIGRQTNMRGDTKKARSLLRDARGRFGGLGADASAVQEQARAQTRAQVRARAQARTQTRVRTRIQA